MSDLEEMDNLDLATEWLTHWYAHNREEWVRVLRPRKIGMGGAPRSPVVAYRGAPHPRGMSWTPSKELAEDCADQHESPLYQTTIEPRAILAVLATEYVVDVSMLGEIEEIEDLGSNEPSRFSAPRFGWRR